MGSDEIEKVAQLQFSESRKKTELKCSEITFAPQWRNKSSKHGISAVQFYKIECSDTQLARGTPLEPRKERRG